MADKNSKRRNRERSKHVREEGSETQRREEVQREEVVKFKTGFQGRCVLNPEGEAHQRREVKKS